jgi:predicted CXXCH cytochrome family protein
MRLLIRTLLRKSTGAVAARDAVHAGAPIRIGRGADCEIHLGDPRVLLHHAAIEERPGGIFIEAQGDGALDVNDDPVRSAPLSTGDVVRLGPYEFTVIAPPGDGIDIAMTCELVRAFDAEDEALERRSTLSLRALGFNPRPWAWATALLVLAVFVAWPLAGHFLASGKGAEADKAPAAEHALLASGRSLWQSGPMSSPHRGFGADCQSCHREPFVQVEASACLDCHRSVGQHADAERFAFASLSGRNCQSCHTEHEGTDALKIRADSFCTSCHSDLKHRSGGKTALLDMPDFDGHPPFRYEASLPRARGGLKFSHETHLSPNGIGQPGGGPKKLVCASCHGADPSGSTMAMPRFETACASCHSLRFEPDAPDRTMPHGDEAAAKQFVRDTYARIALEGGFRSSAADVPQIVRRRPGTPIADERERLDALSWARTRADEVIGGRRGKGLCGECHVVADKDGDPLGWKIAPARPAQAGLKAGRFDHRPHRDVACTTCHAAPKSDDADDLLLPRVATCKTCHGGSDASRRIATGCVGCHDFHLPHRGSIRSDVAKR